MTLSSSKFNWLLLLFVLFSGTVAGQRMYSPGYIIQTGDTLHGLLSYSGFGKESKQLFFKGTETASASMYAPFDIYGFFYEGELFESAIVTTEVSELEMGLVKEGAELLLETDTVFLTPLVKGFKSLYFFTNRVAKEQFYIKVDSEFDLLLYKKYMREEEGPIGIFDNKLTVIENKKYIGQLSVYMSDCPKVTKDLRHLKYSKSSLVKFFWQYNACMDYTPEITIGRKKVYVEFGPKLGLNFTSFAIHKKPATTYLNLDDARKTYPIYGIFLNTYLQRNRRNLSFYNEIYYTEFYASGKMTHHKNDHASVNTSAIIEDQGISMMSALRYTVPVKSFHVYLNAGIAFPLYTTGRNRLTREDIFYTKIDITTKSAVPDFNPSKMAPAVGIGVNYKKFSFDVRFETRGKHKYKDTYIVNMSKIYFMAGYRF